LAFWVVCLVLVAAGASKLSEPTPLATALRGLGLPGTASGPRAVALARGIGAAELILGVGGLAIGGALLAVLVAAAYLSFSVVVVLAIVRRLPSCGCFGSRSGAPSPVHAALNAVSAVVALAAAWTAPPAVADALDDMGAGGWWAVLATLVVAVAVIVVDTRGGGTTVGRQQNRGDT
ncbi:MAG: MauE/DoxX family redox-associated membrane protein, partial [Microthrixaceae bacterium]